MKPPGRVQLPDTGDLWFAYWLHKAGDMTVMSRLPSDPSRMHRCHTSNLAAAGSDRIVLGGRRRPVFGYSGPDPIFLAPDTVLCERPGSCAAVFYYL